MHVISFTFLTDVHFKVTLDYLIQLKSNLAISTNFLHAEFWKETHIKKRFMFYKTKVFIIGQSW